MWLKEKKIEVKNCITYVYNQSIFRRYTRNNNVRKIRKIYLLILITFEIKVLFAFVEMDIFLSGTQWTAITGPAEFRMISPASGSLEVRFGCNVGPTHLSEMSSTSGGRRRDNITWRLTREMLVLTCLQPSTLAEGGVHPYATNHIIILYVYVI